MSDINQYITHAWSRSLYLYDHNISQEEIQNSALVEGNHEIFV